ncbi:MAG: dnaC, partial [Paenibacillus sp.]|nr:dnaC [Paenibacillus sp.]
MSGDNMFMDRVPPQNIEAEQAVLGAILIHGEALITAMERISSDDFYRGTHQRIFEAIVELAEEQ